MKKDRKIAMLCKHVRMSPNEHVQCPRSGEMMIFPSELYKEVKSCAKR